MTGQKTNISRALLDGLKARGARAVFGLPGDYVLGFFNEIEDAGTLPLYTLSHEPGTGFAADGAARYGDGSGRRSLGVAAVTYGAGAMNLVNTAACAWAEHAPVVFISGAPGVAESAGGMLLHHQIKSSDSQMNVFREVTCAQAVLDDPATAPAEIARVLDECVRRSRPVYIELPRDMVDAPCANVPETPPTRGDVNETGLQGSVEDILTRLSQAENPVILAGVEVRRFGVEDDVADIARALDCLLVTSFMGKGMFDRHGDTCKGSYLGLAGDADLRRRVENSDCLVMLGVIPCDTNLGVSGRRIDLDRVIRISNGEICMNGRVARSIPLNDFTAALKAAVPATNLPAQKSAAPAAPDFAPGDDAIRADDIAPVLNAYLAAHPGTPVSADVGDCLFMAMGVEQAPVMASGYYATMGFGVPAAIGAQATSGHRPVVITGDGGFQMTGWELLNCQRFGWGPVVIVLNNKSWEMLRKFQPQAGYTGLGAVSYAQLAADLGGAGERVETPAALAAALENAANHPDSFYLVEVMLGAGDTTATLNNFAAALKKNAADKTSAATQIFS